MSSQVDKLFNRKLKDHTVEPSEQAWLRLSRHLDSKSGGIPWMKVAAILLPAALLLTNLPSRVDLPVPPPAGLAQAARDQAVLRRPEVSQVEQIAGQAVPKNRTAPVQDPQQPLEKPDLYEVQMEEVVTPVEVFHGPEVTGADPAEHQEKEVTMHYSVDDASRFFNKNSLADATPDEKKTSKLQKLKDIAEDLHPVDELRQFKQDILAFSFKSEKNQNR